MKAKWEVLISVGGHFDMFVTFVYDVDMTSYIIHKQTTLI